MASSAGFKCTRTALACHKSADAVNSTDWRQADAADASGTSWCHASPAWHSADAVTNSSAAGFAATTEPPDSVSTVECSDALSVPKC